jgi:hypothetical protein
MVGCGSLLLSGAYALLTPGGVGVALPWPAPVDVQARPAPRAALTVRSRGGERAGPLQASEPLPPLEIRLDFGALPALGSSALASVALSRGQGLEVAVRRHRALQGGLGSGYDVAVSWHRAAIGYTTVGPTELGEVELLQLSPGARLLVAVGPKRTPTAALARRYLARTDGPGGARDVADARTAAALTRRGLALGDARHLAEGIEAQAATRARLTERLGEDYMDPRGSAAMTAAAVLGVPATPSGAAADTLIAAHPDVERLTDLASRWEDLGFLAFLSAPGLEMA